MGPVTAASSSAAAAPNSLCVSRAPVGESSSISWNSCLVSTLFSRPTARQLLKHEFLKKAKDRFYLVKTLLSEGSSVKPQKVSLNFLTPS